MAHILKRLFPGLRNVGTSAWNPRADLITGVSIGLLLIPQSMAYAELAGLPAYYGLYAAIVPVFFGGLFGSMYHLGTGPVAMTSIITASVLVPFARAGTPEYVQLALLLALLVGLMRIALSVLKLTAIVNLISHPVVTAFTNAGALIIATSQVPALLGLPRTRTPGLGGFLMDIIRMGEHLREAHWPSVIFGLTTMIFILAFKKWLPKIPGVLVAVALGIAISMGVGFGDKLGGAVVGVVPRAFPPFSLPWGGIENLGGTLLALLPGAGLVTLISLLEIVALAKAAGYQTREPVNLDRELLGQGLSSLGGSFFGAQPTSASFSRTAVSFMYGATSGVSSLITAVLVTASLFLFAPLLSHLPKPVLSGIIIVAVTKLINVEDLVHIFRSSRTDGTVAFLTFFATLLAAPAMYWGVVAGVGVTLFVFLFSAMRPRIVILGRHPDGALRDAELHELPQDDLVKAVRVDGSLHFANCGYFELTVLQILDRYPDIQYLVLACEGINGIDASGAHTLEQVHEQAGRVGTQLILAGLKRDPRAILERTGLLGEMGDSNVCRDTEAALDFIATRLGSEAIRPEGILDRSMRVNPPKSEPPA